MDVSDGDIARVLAAAGRRERAPAEVERAVHEQLSQVWRDVVAERRERRRRRSGMALAAAILAAAIGLRFAAMPLEPAGEPVASVALVRDDVRVRGRWWQGEQPALAGRSLHGGDVLETGTDGRAALALAGIGSARLDHDTWVRVASADRLVIERGALYVDAGPGSVPGSQLVVETPAGAVRHLGTQYEVRLDGRAVRLRVREGRVEWRSASGAVELGEAGEQLEIASDGEVRRAPSPRYGETWDWVASTAPAIDIEGRPLAEFLSWAGRELGRDVVFETPGVAAEAATIVVHGSIAGLSPAQALDAVLATTSVRSRLDGGRILVSGGNFNDGTR